MVSWRVSRRSNLSPPCCPIRQPYKNPPPSTLAGGFSCNLYVMVTLFKNLDLPEKGRVVAQILNDYNHELFLEKLPPGHPWIKEAPNKPYAVIHRPMGLPEYIIKNYSESMLDERILAQVWEWDTHRFGKKLDKFDALTHARHILEERKRADDLEEKRERMKYELSKKRWS